MKTIEPILNSLVFMHSDDKNKSSSVTFILQVKQELFMRAGTTVSFIMEKNHQPYAFKAFYILVSSVSLRVRTMKKCFIFFITF